MSALGKLSRCVGRSGKQSASLLLDGYCGEQLASKVCLFRYQQSKWLHLDTSCCAVMKPFVPQFNQVRSLFGKSDANDVEIDEESKLPLTHPTKGVLVYYGKLSKYTKQVKIFSLSTSLIALCAQPLILSAAKDDLLFKAGLLATMSTCVFATPVVVHFVTKKYITDIYFNDDTKVFTLATRGFFTRRKEMEYKAEDVEFPFVPRAFVSHIIKGKSFFIEEEEFRGKEIYKHMVGFDKPFVLNKGQSKKKFGLFEDEKDKKVESKSATYIPTQIAFYDDDDDDMIQPQEKQKNQVGSK